MLLIPASPLYSNNALIELCRSSFVLEQRLCLLTEELNSFPLRVDKRTWLKNLAAVEENAHFCIDYCRQLAGDDNFRPNASADCKKALGTASTDKDALLELLNQGNLLAGAILDARSTISRWSQLKAWCRYAEAGFVSCRWNSMGTPHGRYSSENPCLNNRIPEIRATIEADPGYSFLSMDLGQAEYVVWASLSKDPVLSAAFQAGKDFHTEMAEMVQELVPEWHPVELRAAGKTLNFAILYQMQPFALSRKLGCSKETAEKIIDAYFRRTETAANYITDELARAEFFGYVETYYGRRRYCSEYQSSKGNKAIHELEKTLWHHHNAGTAAEIVKLKQAAIWEELRRVGFTTNHVRLAIQMFDECIWQIRNDVLDEVRASAEALWTREEPGFLPFRSSIQAGQTWMEASR